MTYESDSSVELKFKKLLTGLKSAIMLSPKLGKQIRQFLQKKKDRIINSRVISIEFPFNKASPDTSMILLQDKLEKTVFRKLKNVRDFFS